MFLCVVVVFLTSLSSSESSLGLVGAPEEIEKKDLADPYVLKAAQFAVSAINSNSVGKELRVLVNVIKGTSQVGC